jgi:hypothetical protein
VLLSQEREGSLKRETLFKGFWWGERLRCPKASREQEVPSRTNPLGSEKGHSFSGGMKPLELRFEVGYGFESKSKSGKKEERFFFDHERGRKL